MLIVRPRVAVAALAGAGLVVAVAGCGGSEPAPTPTPSAVPLRTIAPCAASVVVPPDSVGAVPKASEPPTVVVSVGGALTFAIPRGGRVGLIGDPDPGGDAQLCTAPKAPADTALLVATAAGYLRIGVQVGIQPVSRVLVRVSPA